MRRTVTEDGLKTRPSPTVIAQSVRITAAFTVPVETLTLERGGTA